MKPELIVDAPILGQKKIWVKKINKPHFDHPYHFHKLAEITWVEKSHGKLIIGDYVGNFTEDELMLSGPELPHLWKSDEAYYKKNKKLFTKAIGLYFPAELVGQMCDEPSCINSYNELMRRSERGLRFFGPTKTTVIQKIKELSASSGLEQMGIFLQIIHLLSHSSEYEILASVSYRGTSSDDDIERFNVVYQYLLKNFHRDIMLSEIAAICNMSPNSFCRFFKQKTQKTLTYFLNEIRIGHAKKLLQNENYPIKDICYECGYNNPVHFFNFFKRIAGKTPVTFREQILSMHKK